VSTVFQSHLLTAIQVQRNDSRHGGVVAIDNTWVFGQILSAVMVIASLNELVHFLLGSLSRKHARSREGRAEAEEAFQQAEGHPDAVPFRSRGPMHHPSRKAAALSTRKRLLSPEILAPTVTEDNAAPGIELLKLDKRDVNASERSVSTSSQLPNQPIGALR
jgi:hypothetical protein